MGSRRLLSAAAAVSLVAAFASPLPAGASHYPDRISWYKYVFATPDGPSFYYPTTDKWSGAVAAGTNPNPDYPWRSYLSNVPNKIVQPIWEDTCPKDEQKVHLYSKVRIPGPPGKLFVSLYRQAQNMKTDSIEWMDLFINGQRILNHVKTVHKRRIFDLPTLPYENNPFTVKITAKKDETRHRCNEGGRSLGVVGEIWGTPESDVSVDTDPLREVKPTAGTEKFAIRATNHGPSDNPFGYSADPTRPMGTNFNVAVYSTQDKITNVRVASVSPANPQSMASCQSRESSSGSFGDGWEVNCRLPHVSPDDSATLVVEVSYQRSCPHDPVQWTLAWNVSGLWDPNYPNGQRSKVVMSSCPAPTA